jgi:UDP-N-acetylmuramate-alanine ligase
VAPMLSAGDVVVTLGAGDIYKIGDQLVEALQ